MNTAILLNEDCGILYPKFGRSEVDGRFSLKQAIFEQIYINNTSSTRAGASPINNWKLMIKPRRTWVKQKKRQYLYYINR